MGKKETREKILQTALQLFGEKGYAGTSTREIAEGAGVNHLTLFRHFGNKENLFRESVIMHKTDRDYFPKVEGQFSGDIEHDLKILAHAYFKENLPLKEVIWINIREMYQNQDFEKLFFEYPNNLYHHLENYLIELHEQGKIPKANFNNIANMFYSTLNSILIFQMTLPYMNQHINPNLDELTTEIAHVYAMGLLHPRKDS
ncbi:TetR/AcrR family transcriptional regulator [Bacillus sp. 03113]|uniref:TetR/AcrR family transcriptional regulator n=1 Tax=Bacillus sp. 03113 TaxID=2578211 RepID=UPI00114260DA|nr:TetR/AcrR family transcriptional regulator [Bacillus sp. 03113]